MTDTSDLQLLHLDLLDALSASGPSPLAQTATQEIQELFLHRSHASAPPDPGVIRTADDPSRSVDGP